MRFRLITAGLLLSAACKTAEPVPETPKAPAPTAAPQAAAPTAAPAEKPVPPGLDASALNPSVNPCDDFYQYACGNWIKATEIPAERSRWSRGFDAIDAKNEERLKAILDTIATGSAPEGTPYAQKLADFYGACMDEAKLDESLPQLRAELAKIQVGTPKARAATLGRLHAQGVNAVFVLDSVQDFKDATQVIAQVDQGGLGLPDRDYYLSDAPKMKAVRDNYRQHVQEMFGLLGQDAARAQASADAVMAIETTLAQAGLSRVDRRVPEKQYHRLEVKALAAAAPGFDWSAYFQAVNAPKVASLNVTHPPYFTEAAKLVASTPAPALEAYLTWHELGSVIPALPKAFQDADFAFESKNLTGAQKDLPRWKKCVRFTDEALGEALAVPFVAQTFGADGKAKALGMVTDIETSFERNLDTLAWMDSATKAKALEKVRKITNKIGYPDKPRNYDALKVERGSFLTSVIGADAFERTRKLSKIGKPLDRTEWNITAPTVNAYYEPSLNEILFPAGILQPPFFSREATTPVNFGAMGMVVGHEFTHGFDDEGRLFDAQGNLTNWWTDESGKQFVQKADCVRRQFDNYVAVDDIKVNGALTLGENVADLGGLKLAHAAMQAWAEKNPQGLGDYRFTPSQQFFLGFAQSWCSKWRPERARVAAQTDPHSPPFLRVNGPLSNLESFRKAFNCPATGKMFRPAAETCQVW